MVRRFDIHLSFIFSSILAVSAVGEPTWYTVTGEDVQVRCGADSTYYTFTTAETGSLVSVTGEKLNWARVNTVGTNFDDAWGYVKYPTSKPGKFEIGVDGTTGTTLGTTPVLAPNMNANDVAHSWRRLCILPRGEQLVVLETFNIEKDALHSEPYTVHRVRLPAQAEGWINMADLKIVDAPIAAQPSLPVEIIEQNDVVGMDGDTPETTQDTPGGDTGNTLIVQWVGVGNDRPIWAAESPLPDGGGEAGENALVLVQQRTHLDILESAYEGMTVADFDAEEMVCLHEEYLAASETEPDPIRAEFARMRARQFEVFATLSDQEAVISGLKSMVEHNTKNAVERELALASSGEYEVVGRLENSAIFNGDERPKLYRIRDPQSGRTLAYMKPGTDNSVGELVGNHVGVMGLITYDATLEVNVIQGVRVDLLASNTAYVQVD
jgi:uncharacterized protein YraI